MRSKAVFFMISIGVLVVLGLLVLPKENEKSGKVAGTRESDELGEVEAMVREVGEIVYLPEKEAPNMVTIQNRDQIIDNQNFFREAKSGDVILVYKKAQRAFLYRPSEHKLVNVATVQIDDLTKPKTDFDGEDLKKDLGIREGEAEDVSRLQKKPVSVEVRNATLEEGADLTFLERIRNDLGDEWVSQAKLGETNLVRHYSVVVAPEKAREAAEKFVELYGFDYYEELDGEPRSQADLLVVLGNDFLE